MPSKATTALAALLFFGSASASSVNTDNRKIIMTSRRTRGVGDHVQRSCRGRESFPQPFTAEDKAWFATPQLALAEGPRLSSWRHAQNYGLDQIDCTWRKPDRHQRRTGNFRQIRHWNSGSQGSARFGERKI